MLNSWSENWSINFYTGVNRFVRETARFASQYQILKITSRAKKYVCGQDTFLRHRCVAALLQVFQPKTILDVGGEGLLSRFIDYGTVVPVNIKNAEVLCNGKHLPFKDDSFEAVVSLDTLEHLAKDQRLKFCAELLRVAGHVVVLCAPLGTPEHIEYEKRMLAGKGLSAENFRLLAEHVEHGLPTPVEVSELTSRLSGRTYYQGTFSDVSNPPKPLFRLWLILQTSRNVIEDLFWRDSKHLKRGHCPYTNRFFLVVPKGNLLVG